MQKRNSIVSIPLLAGIVLSIAIHVGALYSRGLYSPAEPLMKTGRTVIQLTLIPTSANKASIPIPEAHVEQASQPAQPLAPATSPLPEPEPVPAPVAEPETPDSAEQVASMQEDKGITTEAVMSGSFRPAYPRISQRRGETGTVKLSLHILDDGIVSDVVVQQSSGYPRLDEAAISGARKTRFHPAQQLGRPVETTTELEFTFKLTDD